MNYEDLISILLNSIEIIGIFVAIVVGLVVSKILSLKTEQSELKSKISNTEKELRVMKTQLKKKKEENYKHYKENAVYDIIEYVFENQERYNYLSDKTPFVENKYKERFFNHIIRILLNAYKEFTDKKTSLSQYKKENNIKKDSIEELAINELHERLDF